MTRRTRHHLIPASLATVAVLLVACGSDPPASPAEATTPATDSGDFVVLLDDDSDPDQIMGEPGAYAMTARGMPGPPWAVVDIPAGFTNFGFFAVWPQDVADGPAPFRAVQYWTVHAVQEDPCRYQGSATRIGESVEDLADALADQKMTTTTKPEPVTLDGHDGLYLELTLPSDVDFGLCEQGYFFLWEGKPQDAHHTGQGAGQVEPLWILDVDGERVVVAALATPQVSKADADELTAMVESVRFVEPD